MDANLSVFNLVKKERRIILDWQITLHLGSWGPKELTESESFSDFVRKMMSTNMPSERLKTEKVRNPGPKRPRVGVLLHHMSATHMMMKGTGKQHAKENEVVAEYTKLLAERMKKAKEKCQET